MAEDEARARRISELKAKHPKLTWAKIAQEVGVSERAATRWQQTGALKPENAEALAQLFNVDFDHIWVGPRPNTPELFVDRRRRQLNGDLNARLDAIEHALQAASAERRGIEALLERQSRILEGIEALLKRQDGILGHIEDAISREQAATREMDEATKGLLAAAEVASRVYEDASQRSAAASGTRAK